MLVISEGIPILGIRSFTVHACSSASLSSILGKEELTLGFIYPFIVTNEVLKDKIQSFILVLFF